MNRRDFLKTVGAVGSSALLGDSAAAEGTGSETELMGVLVDTTRCIGCRTCEEICAETHGLPIPDIDSVDSDRVLLEHRNPSVTQFSVINMFEGNGDDIYVKKQCMHCNQPACASACLTKAMLKTEDGPVIWREDKCMGCRFCMISCPFDIPKFEYDSPVPKIQKCSLCADRVGEGGVPACVEACPMEALSFGTRSELIQEANRRISQDPDTYVPHIYGEHEAGGTGYLYLSRVPFEQVGFRADIETTSYPELSKDYLYAVPIVLTLWPAFLLALSNATKKESD